MPIKHSAKPIAAFLSAALSAAFAVGAAAADAPEAARQANTAEKTADGGSASFDRFRNRVERIAAEHGAAQPTDGEMGLADRGSGEGNKDIKTGNGDKAEKADELLKAAKKVSPVERIVDMGISKVRAVKGRDGTIMYIADMGRFVFTGSVYDLWQKKQLTTIEEISDAVSRMDLSGLNLKLETLNLARFGTGREHVTIFGRSALRVVPQAHERSRRRRVAAGRVHVRLPRHSRTRRLIGEARRRALLFGIKCGEAIRCAASRPRRDRAAP